MGSHALAAERARDDSLARAGRGHILHLDSLSGLVLVDMLEASEEPPGVQLERGSVLLTVYTDGSAERVFELVRERAPAQILIFVVVRRPTFRARVRARLRIWRFRRAKARVEKASKARESAK